MHDQQRITECSRGETMNNFDRDWKDLQTNEDKFETKTMFISIGLATSFLIMLLLGGAYL